MQNLTAKLEIMELFSKYLLCLDERRFDTDSFAEIFTENAEVSIPSKMTTIRGCSGLKETRDIHMTLFRLVKSSHHVSSDYVFTSLSDKNAEVRCKLSVYLNPFGEDDSGKLLVGTAKFYALKTDKGWRIQRMNRKTNSFYNFAHDTKTQEAF